MEVNPNGLSIFRLYAEKHGIAILRFSVGIIFLWFGALKFFPGNAAQDIAGSTISWITAGAIQRPLSVYLLGGIECIIGLALLLRRALHVIIPVLYLQMCGTILPLFIYPDKTWVSPFMPTLEGQYIIKNMVLIAAAIVMGASARGGKLIVDPEVAREAKHKQEKKLDELSNEL